MNRLIYPLDLNAIRAANATIAQETGGRPLTMSAQDAALRRKWTEAYLTELSKNKDGAQTSPDASATLKEPALGEYQDYAGADTEPSKYCAECQNKPGSIKVFFVHAFDESPIPQMPVKLIHNGNFFEKITDSEGMISLENVMPGSIQIQESNTRNDLPEHANRTKPNNRYFMSHVPIGWAESNSNSMTRDDILATGLVKLDTSIKSGKTKYIVFRKYKVYEAGIFAHVENLPASKLTINEVIGHTFLTCQVPGSSGGLGNFSYMAGAGYFSSGTRIVYKNEIARGHWPAEGIGEKELITGTDGKILNEEIGGYFNADTRDWATDKGAPDFHAEHKHFDIDYITAKKLLARIAELENDPPDYVLARTFRGVAIGRQTISDAVGKGDHCTTSAIKLLEYVGISVNLKTFSSPASVIEAINGADIPNNDNSVMKRIQDDIMRHYKDAGTGAHPKAWNYD